jgi:hypothetical protein
MMTAGGGIAHAEQTPRQHSGQLNGVQLWVALPEAPRQGDAAFQHVVGCRPPTCTAAFVQVFAGSLAGVTSPAIHHTPISGAELRVHPGERLTSRCHGRSNMPRCCSRATRRRRACRLPRTSSTTSVLAGQNCHQQHDRRAGAVHRRTAVRRDNPDVVELAARRPEEIAAARADWEAGRRFGPVKGYDGSPLAAPPLARFARPEGAS